MAQLTETMQHNASEISADSAARLSRRHAHRTRPVAVRPLASLAAAADASTGAVRWRRGLVATVDHYPERSVLRLADRTITFPSVCGPAVEALHQGAVVDAMSLPGLDRDDATVLIRRLLREAVVIPATVIPAALPEP